MSNEYSYVTVISKQIDYKFVQDSRREKNLVRNFRNAPFDLL